MLNPTTFETHRIEMQGRTCKLETEKIYLHIVDRCIKDGEKTAHKTDKEYLNKKKHE